MKTPEQMAEEWTEDNDECEFARDAFLAGYQAGHNQALETKDRMDNAINRMFQKATCFPAPTTQWISVKERLPTDADGVTQLWMRGRSLAELVLGCHAVMFEHNEKIEGVLDINKPDGIWDLSDFTHWMPLPKPPENI